MNVMDGIPARISMSGCPVSLPINAAETRARPSSIFRISVIATCTSLPPISRATAQRIFHLETTPNVAVADAVRMSMTIPLYFEALRFDGQAFGQGDYYVDGGLFNNYPIHIFDHPRYACGKNAFREGTNWETLGLFLFPSKLKNGDQAAQPDNLWEFLDLAVRSVYDSHQVASLVENVSDQRRTISIDDCGIKSTRFDLAPDSREFKALYRAGRIAALNFLK